MCRVGHIALKSVSPLAFFVAPQSKLRFSKAQLRSLHFNILDATLIATFMNGFGMVGIILTGSHSVVVESSARNSEDPSSYIAMIRIRTTM
jgi:hypothetical protein